MSALHGPEDEPTTLRGEVAGRPYIIRDLGRLLPRLIGGPVMVYNNSRDFLPSVEGMRVDAQLPQAYLYRATVSFDSTLYLPSTPYIANYMGNVLNTFLQREPTISAGGSEFDISVVNGVNDEDNVFDEMKYAVTDDKGNTIGTIFAPIATRNQVVIGNGYWDTHNGRLYSIFPNEEIRNIGDVKARLKSTMDLSSFVINVLNTYYLDDNDVVSIADPKVKVAGVDRGGRESISLATLEELDESPSDSKVTLESVAGLENVKAVFKKIIDAKANPNMVAGTVAKQPRNVLLCGPRGTGKGMLVEALANKLDAKLLTINPDDIDDILLSGSQTKMNNIFENAVHDAKTGHVVMFFDQLDEIMDVRGRATPGSVDDERHGVVTIFKQAMSKIAYENPNIYIIASTIEKELLDPTLFRTGRFDTELRVPLPDDAVLHQIFIKCVEDAIRQKHAVFEDNLDLFEAATISKGLSGADINAIVTRLVRNKSSEKVGTGSRAVISGAELTRAIRLYKNRA